MPNVLIMNQGTEHTKGYDPTRTEPLRKSIGRCSWLLRDGDVIVSPLPIEPAVLEYVGATLGFDGSSVKVMIDEGLRTDALSLSAAQTEELASVLSGPTPGLIMPCVWTADVADFAARVGVGNPRATAFAAQRGTDLFLRKAHFRQLATGASIPIPDGSVVTSALGLQRAIERYLPVTGTVIVKKNNSAGGLGNIAVTTGPIGAVPGAKATRGAPDTPQAASFAVTLFDDLTDVNDRVVVVEVYHSSPLCFYFEYFLGDDGLPRYLHSGDVRLRSQENAGKTELVWLGLDTPIMDVPAGSLSNALTLSSRLAALAGQLGCRGHINIDAIVTDAGELLFNETNLRWGGGSPIHSIGEQLFGPRFADHHALSLVREVTCPPRKEAVKRLEARGQHFTKASGEGAILLACSEHEAGTTECLLVAPSRLRIRELEAAVRETLS